MTTALPVPLSGHRLVAALWFPVDTGLDDAGPEPTERARILACWRPGCTLWRAGPGLLLRLAQPERLATRVAPALVLEARDGGLTALPEPPPASGVLLAWRGQTIALGPADLLPVDVAAWIDVSGWRVVTVEALGPAPEPPKVAAAFSVRAALGRPGLPDGAGALEAALTGEAVGEPGAGGTGISGALIGAFAAVIGGVAAALSAIFPPPATPTPSPATPSSAAPTTIQPEPAEQRKPSALERWARDLVAPLWGHAFGGAAGRYLNTLLSLLESTDPGEALRWAIPLGGTAGPQDTPGWGGFRPRDSLRLGGTRWGSGRTSALSLAPDIYGRLRRLYERALERLIAEGRIEEAVFVLVDLLREHARAVDLLERDGRFALAAEVADAGDLPPERVIRLWMRAGDPGRAILVARRRGGHAAAAMELDRAHPDLAVQFRWRWASLLADGGDPAGACDVAWPAPPLREDALRWIDAALFDGGGAMLIASFLDGTPEGFSAAATRLAALTAATGATATGAADPGTAYERIRQVEAAMRGLMTMAADGQPGPRRDARTLLRPLVRVLVAEQATSPELVGLALLTRARDACEEPALAADLPSPVPTTTLLSGRTTPLVIAVARPDVGRLPVHDVVYTPLGLFVALGESGGRLYAPDGRIRATFDVPMHALVPADGGGRLIALATRSWGQAVSRIDLAAGRAERWHDGTYTAWAPDYDGNGWLVARDQEILVLDAQAPAARNPEALWRVDRLSSGVVELARSLERWTARLAPVDGHGGERWVHIVPGNRLTERRPTAALARDGVYRTTAEGHLHHAVIGAKGLQWHTLTHAGPQTMALGDAPAGVLTAAWIPAGGSLQRAVALTAAAPGEAGVHVVWGGAGQPVHLHLNGATTVCARLGDRTFAVGDDLGRALVMEGTTGAILRSIRT